MLVDGKPDQLAIATLSNNLLPIAGAGFLQRGSRGCAWDALHWISVCLISIRASHRSEDFKWHYVRVDGVLPRLRCIPL